MVGQKAPESKSAKVATAVTSDKATAGQNYRGGRGARYQCHDDITRPGVV